MILTKRLQLRLIELSDLDSIHKLLCFPETDEFNTFGIPKHIKETKASVDSWISENEMSPVKNYNLAIENRMNTEFIGLFGLKLGKEKNKRGEVWYKLYPDFWNKGYATEALRAVIHFGFESLKLHRIEAGCAVENIGSIRVLEKAGMVREGRLRQTLPLKSGWSDNYEYSILETDER